MNRLIFIFTFIFASSSALYTQTAEELKKLGNIELDSANYTKAISFYLKAIEIDSTYFDAYFNLGIAFSYQSDFDKAIENYKKAIHVNDSVAETYFAVGALYANLQETDKAIEYYRKGLHRNPGSAEEQLVLGMLYNEKEYFSYATLHFRKAAQLGNSTAQQMLTENQISWKTAFTPPQYDSIAEKIKQKESNLYYPVLWARYQQGDSTLNLEEKRHIYYGYVFHENFSPYMPGGDTKKAYAILNKEQPTEKEWKTLIGLLDDLIQHEPFNIRLIYYQSIAYEALQQQEDLNRCIHKIKCLMDALNSTGDGLEKESAIHVIAPSHEYGFLFLHNFSAQSQALINGGFDLLYLQPNKKGITELWFDVNQALGYMEKKLK